MLLAVLQPKAVLERGPKVHSLPPKAPLARRSAALAGQGQFVPAVATVLPKTVRKSTVTEMSSRAIKHMLGWSHKHINNNNSG